MKRRLMALAVCLLPVGMIFLHLGDFPFPSGSAFSDFAVSHYPNALFLQRSVLQYHEIPFWSNTILSGYPFAANPLSGLWYPPGWLAFLLPLPAGLNVVMALHMIWGGFGMFRLFTRQGMAFPAALAGAVVFAAMPKSFAHYAAGHVTLLYAVAWTPWLLLVETRQKPRLLAGAVLGLILLADVRWALPAGLIWAGWKLFLWIRQAREPSAGSIKRFAGRFSLSILLNGLVACLIAAPLLILLVEYTSLSTRAFLTAGEQMALTLPPSNLLGLVVPGFTAYAEWVMYFGALPLLLLVYAIAVPGIRKRTSFWIGVLVFSILVSLGSAVPGLDQLWQLPGFSLLRVPSRMMFLGGVALAAITACSLDELLARRPLTKTDPVFWMTPLAAFAWLLTLGLWILSGNLSFEFLWSAVALTSVILLIAIRQRTSVPDPIWAGTILAVLLADLIGVNALNTRFDPPETVLSAGAEAAAAFESDDGLFRVYSPSYSLPQQTAAQLGLELVDGVDPLQLNAYAAFFNSASGIERKGYSVTLPPDPLELLEENPGRAEPDADRLGLLNVRYLVADYPLESDGLALFWEDEGRFVYDNQKARPRAWVQTDERLVSLRSQRQPFIAHRSPNRIEITAEGPGLLVLSEVMYPGWRAWLNGQEVEIQLVEGLLRAVSLPTGQHSVRFQFVPRGMTIGIVLAVVGWLLVIGFPFIERLVFRFKNEEEPRNANR